MGGMMAATGCGSADWTDKYRAVWIVCDPVIYHGKPTKWIGDPCEILVAVPDAFFKIVAKEGPNGSVDMLAFLIPQEGVGKCGSSSKSKLTPYLTSVDVVEALTGLEFFTVLSGDEQEEIEKGGANGIVGVDVERADQPALAFS